MEFRLRVELWNSALQMSFPIVKDVKNPGNTEEITVSNWDSLIESVGDSIRVGIHEYESWDVDIRKTNEGYECLGRALSSTGSKLMDSTLVGKRVLLRIWIPKGKSAVFRSICQPTRFEPGLRSAI